MAALNDSLITLTTVPTEMEGQLLLNLLEEHGIPATASGGMTSQFRAEAPGAIQVMVMQDQLSNAKSIIEKQNVSNSHSSLVNQDTNSSEYRSRLTKFGFWTLIVGNAIALIVLLACL